MLIPITMHCSACRGAHVQQVDPAAPSLDFVCACGHRASGLLDPRQPFAERMLRRAIAEIGDHGDISFAILLAALALESEIWRARARAHGPLHDAATDAASALHALVAVVEPRGLEAFVVGHPVLRTAADAIAPVPRVTRVDDGLQAALFRPRDEIVHFGALRHGNDEARRAIAWALLGLAILDTVAEEHRAAAHRSR